MSDLTQAEEYILPSGEQAVIIRGKDGKFLPGTKGHVITQENAREHHDLYRKKNQMVALRAINDAAIQSGAIIPPDLPAQDTAWYAINQHAATVLFMSDKASGVSDLVTTLGRTTGIMETDKTRTDNDGSITIDANVRDMLADLADIARAKLENL
jgi:hypothetical protein